MKTRFYTHSINRENLVVLICTVLIFLMYLSKISLKWLGMPRSIPPFIYQNGLHPFVNFALNFGLGGMLLFFWARFLRKMKLHWSYVLFLIFFLATLISQTFLQILIVNVSSSPIMQLGGLVIALAVVFIYGVFIPTLFPIEDCNKWTMRVSVGLILLSLILLPIFAPFFFRGGRFIGVFKHIPHMVSASTFAFIFFIPEVFNNQGRGMLNVLFKVFILAAISLAVLLTATKAAIITVMMVFLIVLFTVRSRRPTQRLFKWTFFVCLGIFAVTMGPMVVEFAYDIFTGQRSFGLRPAQNGIATRMEEVWRGLEIFKTSPWFGRGILYKFMGGGGVDAGSYNSLKDPHNLFVSAGVVGGWPLLILSVIGYLMMVVGAIRGLRHKNPHMRVMGLFLLSHLPVFIIYHLHVYLGGLGDRMYWLIFGYLATVERRPRKCPGNLFQRLRESRYTRSHGVTAHGCDTCTIRRVFPRG